jgi:DNA-binding PadR family transcriptional regulator
MRMSSIQSDVLFALLAIENMGHTAPVPSTSLITMINKGRSPEIIPISLRRSMHTLVEHKLLHKLRNEHTARLAFTLTDEGRKAAQAIVAEREQSQDE